MPKVTLPSTWISDIEAARDRAVIKARAILPEPVVLGWRDNRTDAVAPDMPGAKLERRREHAMANSGELDIDVGSDYHFVIGEAADFEASRSRVTEVKSADGSTYLCASDACTDEDRKRNGEGLGNNR